MRTYRTVMSSANVHAQLSRFVAERDWDVFHSPENLAKSITIEAGELLECFQWSAETDQARVADELADVLTYCHLLSMKLGLDPDVIVLAKLAVTMKKYPVSTSRGRSTKYDQLPD